MPSLEAMASLTEIMSNLKTAVLGVGNILMQDEGVGVHLIQELMEKYSFDPHVQLIDGGVMGIDLLPYFDEYDRMIILDAVDFDKEPGFINVFENENILALFTTKMSLHHLGLKDVLSYAKLLDQQPNEMCLIGMQPDEIEMKMELSKTIAGKMEEMKDLVFQKLEGWGIKVLLKE